MMKRKHFNLIKTGRKSKLALAVGLALAMSAMGSVYASGNDDTFKNFANKDGLMKAADGFKNHEFKNSTGLEAIGADKAYALGYSGDGVTLGIVDTGVRTDHEEFEGKVDLVNETVNDWTDKETWHGSHVAGIMVAKKSIGSFGEKNKNMMGVAFNANLKSIDHGVDGKNRLNLAKKHILTLSKDVKIINNSWNPVTETGGDSFIDFAKKDIKNNDRVYVFSAGNDGNIDVSREMTGKFANDANTKSNFINVVNIDDINNISVDSNIAKGAQKNTVCAIGVNVNSILANSLSDYTEMSGTSMSAPYVSGTLGLVQEANPYLTGNQLVDVVLTTANTNFEHPKFAIINEYMEDKEQGKNNNGEYPKKISKIKLLCIDYNDKKNNISKDLKQWLSCANEELYYAFSEILNVNKYSQILNPIKKAKYDYEGIDGLITSVKNSELYRRDKQVIDIINKMQSSFALGLYEQVKEQTKQLVNLVIDLRAEELATELLSGLENQKDMYQKYDYTFEEVYGQGIVDAGKAVQGLGAIDVDRLSKDDITTKYSNDKFYMYKVDTKKVADNFRGRNYSIWSNDIGDKNVTGINAGLEKTGDVKLILLGENTYGGATVAKGGFLQIVRGVGGDVYVGGDSNVDASAEINGYAKNIYALESGKVKISDIVSKNYANVDADFLAAALPDTNKVDINGGLFAIGKNSITGEGSTINVNLTRSDSAIKGALYQDELGKINLSLANEAKFILQQGTGYYAGNSYKSNDTVNNLRMDSFATFDMSQDGVYSTLKIDKLQDRDGQFILGTNLANCKGDSIFVTGSDAGEHWISIVDKNGVYADNEDGAKKVLVATTPDNVKFKGLALAQDMGVNQYNFTPNIYYDENIKGWYFDGFRNEFAKPEVDSVINKSGIYTTDNVFNNGIYGNGAHYLDGSWKETAIKVIKGKAPYLIINKTGIDENIIGVSGAVQFLGDGPVNIKVENNDPMKSYIYGTTTGLKYRGDHILNANQDMKIDVKSYNDTYGIYNFVPKRYTGYRIETTLNFNGNLDINLKNTNNAKTVAIINNREININKDLNINVSGGYANGISNVPEGKLCVGGNVNITTDGNTEGFTGIRNGTTNNTYDDETNVHIDGDLNVDLTHSKSKSDVAIKNTRLGNMLVKGNINVKCVLEDNYSIENSGVMTVGKINSDSSIKNNGTIKTSNGIFCNGVLNNVGGDLELSGVSKISRLYNLDKISGEELTINELVNSGGNINIDELTLGKKLNNTGNIEIQGLVGGDNTNPVDISGHGAISINQNKNSMVKFVGAICNDTKLTMNLVGKESYFDGHFYTNTGINYVDADIQISDGAAWIIDKRTQYNSDLKQNVKSISLDNGIIKLADCKNELIIHEFDGKNGIFLITLNQDTLDKEKISAGKIIINKNSTENSHHSVNLIATQPDFLLTNDTKINPFTIIEDSSEKNGGYKLNFTINPFDAGAYNYTPTLTNEKSKDNVDLWKVTDIKLTGSTPDPTPDPNPDPNPNPTPDPDPNPNPTPDPDPNPNPTPDPDPNPNPTPDPNPNPNPDPNPKPDPDPTPDPNPTPAPVLSNLTYNTRANAINNYYRWRDEYNNLQKRLGDLRMSTEENGLWARTFHGKEESGKYGLNNQYIAFQIGYDKRLLQDDGSKWFVGAAVTSYDGKTNYAKQGKADNNSIGLALYGSYLGEKGHYFDVVARHSRLKSELTSYAAGTGNKITGDYHNWGSSLSMEYGRRISMKHDFYLQPEAELTYGTTSSASYSLSDGSRVKQDGISSLTARAGLTVGKEFKNSNIFASISAVHDFGDDNVFSITDKYGKTYKDISNLKDSWYELSVGGNVKFNNNTYVYADLEKTFGGDIQTKWRYNFGVRYSF